MPVLRVSSGFFDRIKQIQHVLSELTEREISPAEITDKILLTVLVSEHPAVMLGDRPIVDDFDWGIKPVIIQVNGIKRRAHKKASIEFERAIHDTPKMERSVATMRPASSSATVAESVNRFKPVPLSLEDNYELL